MWLLLVSWDSSYDSKFVFILKWSEYDFLLQKKRWRMRVSGYRESVSWSWCRNPFPSGSGTVTPPQCLPGTLACFHWTKSPSTCTDWSFCYLHKFAPPPPINYFWSVTFKAVHIYKVAVRGHSSAGTHSIRSMQWSGAEQRSCHALQKQGCICKRSVPSVNLLLLGLFLSPLLPFLLLPLWLLQWNEMKWNEMKWNEILQKHTCLETERGRENWEAPYWFLSLPVMMENSKPLLGMSDHLPWVLIALSLITAIL